MANPYDVKPGQIWRDLDPRFQGQSVYKRVIRIDEEFAYCEGIRNGRTISKSKISLRRFKYGSRGYELLSPEQALEVI